MIRFLSYFFTPVEEPEDLNNELLDFIARHEGLRLVCYLDSANVPTIGYGHTKTVKRSDVGVKTITKEEALKLLKEDVAAAAHAAHAITGLHKGKIFNGVTSFIFNLGPGALHGKSTQIGRHLLNKDYEKAAKGMNRYVFAGGRRLRGLVQRRKEEANLVWKSPEKTSLATT